VPRFTEEERKQIRNLVKDMDKLAMELVNMHAKVSSWIDFLNAMLRKRSRWEEEEEGWGIEGEEEEGSLEEEEEEAF
jgi:hypothetical protein